MFLKALFVFVLTYQQVFSDEQSPDFQKVLSNALKYTPHLRVELRDDVKSDFENVYVDFLLRQSICPIIVSTYMLNETKPRPQLRESFAIVSDMENLAAVVDYFARAAGDFFFIIPNTIHPLEVDQIFENLWYSRGIFRTLLLTNEGIMFYDPFSIAKDTQKFGDILPLGDRDLSRVFNDMKGYPFRVQIFKSVYARPMFDQETNEILSAEGADAEVAQCLQEKMNFTLILQQPTEDYFGERAPNGTYNGAIGMLINGKTDISLTGFFVKDYMVPDVEFTVAVYDDQLCCYVPKAPRIPQSILPIFAIRFEFWVTFILAAFVCATIWVITRRINLWIAPDQLSKLHLSKHLRHQLIRIYIDTWVVWVRVNINSYPPFLSERILILSLCLVSVIFGAIIESSLATVYIHPLYYKDINTLHELDDSGLDIVYKFTSFKDDLFFSETSPLFAALNKKLKHLNNLNADVMRDIAEVGGIASVSRYSSLMLESMNYILGKKVHIVKECPKYYTIAYVMPKDSPFEERINGLLLRFLNAGLVNKWIKDMHNKANMKTQAMQESSVLKVLTMVDLQLAFYVIILGSVLSAVSFGAEMYLHRRKNTRRITNNTTAENN